MKISTICPTRYATGDDLAGKHISLTIARVVMESMHAAPGTPASDKPVVYFVNAVKGIILTPPLARQIAEILGDETDTWTGKRITIYPVPMRVAGIDRIAIRAQPATNGGVTTSALATSVAGK